MRKNPDAIVQTISSINIAQYSELCMVGSDCQNSNLIFNALIPPIIVDAKQALLSGSEQLSALTHFGYTGVLAFQFIPYSNNTPES